jgi:hypothetical protein
LAPLADAFGHDGLEEEDRILRELCHFLGREKAEFKPRIGRGQFDERLQLEPDDRVHREVQHLVEDYIDRFAKRAGETEALAEGGEASQETV